MAEAINGSEGRQITKQGGFNGRESGDGRTLYYAQRDVDRSPIMLVNHWY